MTVYYGLDIGGTKIAMAAFSATGEKLYEDVVATPADYDGLMKVCADSLTKAKTYLSAEGTVGVCTPGAMNKKTGGVISGNLRYLNGRALRDDLTRSLGSEIKLANDANCIALAEAIDGAGQGYETVLGVTISTGLGSGLIVRGGIVDGPNGMTGEFGHVPLPFFEKGVEGFDDQPICICGQMNCIERVASGSALMRLYEKMTGKKLSPSDLPELAKAQDEPSLKVLDLYYEIIAKAMIVPIHVLDPDVIVVSGGVSKLTKMFSEVPKRWGKYCVVKDVKTAFVPAFHGPIASVRGAAWLWRKKI